MSGPRGQPSNVHRQQEPSWGRGGGATGTAHHPDRRGKKMRRFMGATFLLPAGRPAPSGRAWTRAPPSWRRQSVFKAYSGHRCQHTQMAARRLHRQGFAILPVLTLDLPQVSKIPALPVVRSREGPLVPIHRTICGLLTPSGGRSAWGDGLGRHAHALHGAEASGCTYCGGTEQCVCRQPLF